MPAWRNRTDRYGVIHVAFHWITALTVIGLFLLGIWMVDLTYYDPWYNKAPMIHKSVGMLLIVFLTLRVFWRLSNPMPPPTEQTKPWEARVAHIAHFIIYLLLFGILITGYLIPTATGDPVNVFNWFSIPALPAIVDRQETVIGQWHEVLAWVLIALVVLHAAAALKHHIFNRDETLRRMLGLGKRQ